MLNLVEPVPVTSSFMTRTYAFSNNGDGVSKMR